MDHLSELAHEAARDDDEAFYRHNMKAALHTTIDMHRRGYDGNCVECGKPCPCPTINGIATALKVLP